MYRVTREGVVFSKTGSSRNPLRELVLRISREPDMVIQDGLLSESDSSLLSKALSYHYLISSSGITLGDWRRVGRMAQREMGKGLPKSAKPDLVWGNLPEDMPYLVKISSIAERSRHIRVQFTVLEPLQFLGERLHRDYYPRGQGIEYWERFLKVFGFSVWDWPECRSGILNQTCVSISASRDNPVFTGKYGTHLRTESVDFWEGSNGKVLWTEEEPFS